VELSEDGRFRYACWGCEDEIPWPNDMGDVYCNLCLALLMFDMEAAARECGHARQEDGL
jgi:hypothetical protein